jgi:hypothetical protein
LKINNSYKFESTVTALKNGRIVNKPKGYRFQIGDYVIYNKEKNCYYNLSYALIKNLRSDNNQIIYNSLSGGTLRKK